VVGAHIKLHLLKRGGGGGNIREAILWVVGRLILVLNLVLCSVSRRRLFRLTVNNSIMNITNSKPSNTTMYISQVRPHIQIQSDNMFRSRRPSSGPTSYA
jgi:hypothetical protein